jgi:hypothetical protein
MAAQSKYVEAIPVPSFLLSSAKFATADQLQGPSHETSDLEVAHTSRIASGQRPRVPVGV